MKKYLIELIGEKLDIEDLIFGLRTSKWKIIEELDKYYLTPETLNKTETQANIISKANEFITILNGSAKIFYEDHRKVKTGSLTIIDENGKKSIISFMRGGVSEYRSRTRGTLTDSNKPLQKTPTIIEVWIAKSEKHKSVRDVLHLFNNLTWSNLYKIYELINYDVGGKNNIFKFIEKSKIKNFKHTAQSRSAIGDLARHAVDRYKPPKNPLTINESHTVIAELFKNWIKSKG